MTDMQDFQNRGEHLRRQYGIDGTAGDAQDAQHPYVRDEPTGACLACGLSESYHQRKDCGPDHG